MRQLVSIRHFALLLAGFLSAAPVSVWADEGETDPEPATSVAAAKPSTGESDTQAQSSAPGSASEGQRESASDASAAPTDADSEAVEDQTVAPFSMLGSSVAPGETRRLSWVASESFAGISVPTPVLVAHGTQPGPVLCLTAAVHGDELNGIEMVRRVLYGLDAENLAGTVVGVPIVNLFGFRRASRYLPDRRDLNRYFPGDPHGSSASRIAHAFFTQVVEHCDYLVDLHTGSFHRTNLPQLRADLDNPDVLELTQGFGATAVLHNDGQVGTLRRAASDAGVPAVTLEAGEPTRFQPEEVAHGVKGIRTLLNKLGMVKRVSFWGEPQPIYYESDWIRADTGGILFGRVSLGEDVEKGQLLGTVTDPITNKRSEIRAPEAGRVLGMALNQVVIPGFASFRLGIAKSSKEVAQEAQQPSQAADEQPQTSQQTPETSSADESARAAQPEKASDATTPAADAPAAAGDVESPLQSPAAPPAAPDAVEEERPD